jgi:tetratricopeptide (TPR) repeat protein
MRTLEGQILLWTGDAREAIPVLQAALAESPADTVARLALVDAFRFAGRPYEAWEAATPLLGQRDLEAERRVVLADLALRADRPRAVEPVLTQAGRGDIPAITRETLRGRALLDAGRPVEAARVLGSIAPRDLGPEGALALLDSVIASRGWTAALEVAAPFTARTPEWRDVMVRQTVILAMNGRAGEARTLRAALSTIDPVLQRVADAEQALASERPLDALRSLEGLASAAYQDRIDDLVARSLAEVGDLAASAAITDRLAASRPEFVMRSARAAELAWRRQPTPESLEQLLAIQARVPEHVDLAVLAAEVLSQAGRHADAVTILEERTNQLTVSGRIVLAQALRATNRLGDALVVLETADLPTESAAILRGELIAAVHGEVRADAYFRALATGPDVTPALYKAWAALVSTAADRARILAASTARFPDDSGTLTFLAASLSALEDHRGAAEAARRAILQDDSNVEAWLTLIDATAAAGRDRALDQILDEFAPHVARDATVAIAAAAHVAGLARGPRDPLIPLTLSWLDTATGATDLALPRALARAHILALAERWNEAIAATDQAITADPQALEALRLRAEVLSWSGQHARAIEAYDAYLALNPLDREARRHQARVAGWAGWREEAARRYTILAADFPADPVIAIERKAKLAFLDGRWREAAGAYEEWLRLEPSNSEAHFEMAEALRADGETDRADRALEGLALSTGHQLAGTARERALHNERPAVSVIARQRSSDGAGDERLLDLEESGAGLSFSAGANTRTTIALEGVYFDAASGESRRTGSHSNVGVAERLSRTTTLEGRLDWWRVGASTNVLAGGTRLAWKPSDRWLATAGVQRDLILENVATMDLGLVGYGPAAALRFDSPRAALSATVHLQRISDGNSRGRATVSFGRVVSARVPQLRVLAWSEFLTYRQESQFYFAPAGFLRVDAGASYTHQFSRPRFQGDRRNELSVSYLIGVDNRDAVYHHPAARLSVELVEGLAVDAQADWIRSPVYDETTFVVGLRIGGSAGRR